MVVTLRILVKRMENKLVKDIMEKDFSKVNTEDTLKSCMTEFEKLRTPVSIVTDDEGNYKGIIAKDFILRSDLNEAKTRAKKLTEHVPILNTEDTVRRAAHLMIENKVKLLPVIDNEKLMGSVTDEKIIHEAVLSNWGNTKIKSIMTDDPHTVNSDANVGSVVKLFKKYNISHAPVVDKQNLVGIISLSDIHVFLTTPRSRQTQGDRKGTKKRMMQYIINRVMTSPVITTKPDVKAKVAEKKMHDNNIESLIVVDENLDKKVIGIVTKHDFLEPIAYEVSRTQMFTLQVIPRDVKITDEIKGKMLERFDDFRKKVAEIVIPSKEQRANLKIIFKSVGQTTKKGDRRIQCDMQLFSRLDLFNVKSEGYGLFDVYQEALSSLESRIKRKIAKIRKYE